MSDTSYLSGGDDDMPRTVRQQKEARARDQAAREIINGPRSANGSRSAFVQASTQAATARGATANSLGVDLDGDYRGGDFPQSAPGEYPLTTVTRVRLPFLHMVGFFLKAVIAAIPALILLMLVLWGMGQFAKHFLPWLVQMKIDITFPR